MAGNVVPLGVAPLYVPSVVDVGAVHWHDESRCPTGQCQFQIGINSTGNTFSSNSGSFAIAATVTTNAPADYDGDPWDLTAYYSGDSPTSGPVGSYIWKNPDDPGGRARRARHRTRSDHHRQFVHLRRDIHSRNSALPGIGSPSVPMEWTTLNPESVATGTNPVFAAPITKTYPSNTHLRTSTAA